MFSMGLDYDNNGNLKTYNRRGQMPDLSFNVIDNLTYTYGDAARPDRLTNVTDLGNANKGFKYVVGAAAYQYDLQWQLHTRQPQKTVLSLQSPQSAQLHR